MKKSLSTGSCLLFLIIVLSTHVSAAGTGQDKERKMAVSVESLFAYDRNLPLMAEEEALEKTDTFIKYHVKYFSAHGQFVTAILTLPARPAPPYPAVIFQHGFGGNKESEALINYGTGELVKRGYAVISIDAAQHGERKTALTKDGNEITMVNYPYVMRDVFVQTVIDIRRAVDYLQKRGGIDKDRIYYIGISMGAIQGVITTSVEKRIKGLVTVVGGGNFLECNPMYKAMPGPRELVMVMDPINYADKISPRPLLMLNGKNDQIIPPACAKALFDTAGEPKKQIFYDTKHNVPLEEGMNTIIEWLKVLSK